ncbi:ISPsy24 transposase OrfB [Pseudomonas aeruginosa PA38182]|nr:ISPsy24 transposase OrfB [Pseudomonas aeruginosa PA38182]
MERLFRSLKLEWVPSTGYLTAQEAQRDISHYLMHRYNWIRPHQFNDGFCNSSFNSRNSSPIGAGKDAGSVAMTVSSKAIVAARPRRVAISPNSPSKPRTSLHNAVRARTRRLRTRCIDCTACCSALFTGT